MLVFDESEGILWLRDFEPETELDYLQIVGSRYTELERIEQQIEEYLAYIESSRDFKPSDSLKNLYRQKDFYIFRLR